MTWKRIATALVLIPIVVGVVWFGPLGLLALFAALVACLSIIEYFALVERVGMQAYKAWTLVCSVLLFVAQWMAVQGRAWVVTRDLQLIRFAPLLAPTLDLVLLIFVIGLALIIFSSERPLSSALGDIGASATAILFIALPLSTLVRLRAVDLIGPQLLLFTLLLVWVGDTLAYFVGKFFGSSRMAPQLSSGKTWEGAAANLIGSVIVGMLFARWLMIDRVQCMGMAALANVAGQIGDLLESAYKRSAALKDSGTLLPGHGGVLDRIDALILAAPVVWYYFNIVIGQRV